MISVDALLLLAGLVLLAVLARDVFITSLTLRGGGSLVLWLSRGIWRTALALHRRRSSHGLLSLAGGLTATATLFAWLLTLWAAWSLVFAGAGPAIIDARTGQPADVWARIYYAGFNVFTLGLGDYRPVGPVWQLSTAAAAAVGLIGTTLAITYLIPTLSAAVGRQALAGQISLLGASPYDVAQAAALDPTRLSSELANLRPPLLALSQQHLAYPILAYFHVADSRFALPLRVAILHEGLLLARCGVRNASNSAELERSLMSIGLFLDTLKVGEDRPNADLAAPSLEPLNGAGVETADRQAFEAGLARWASQRRSVATLLLEDGWCWRDVYGE